MMRRSGVEILRPASSAVLRMTAFRDAFLWKKDASDQSDYFTIRVRFSGLKARALFEPLAVADGATVMV